MSVPPNFGAAAMFGAPPAAAFVPQNGPPEPMTDNQEANAFFESLGVSLECEQQLRSCEMPVRMKLLSVVGSKLQQGGITNVTSYFLGVIRNEKRAMGIGGNYKAFGGSGAQQNPGPYQPPSSVQMMRALPSPHQSPRPPTGPPGWVTEAWALSQRPTQFVRKMMSVLGPESMATISHFNIATQVSVLTTLLVTPTSWADPRMGLRTIVSVLKDLPPLPLAASIRAPARSGKPLIVLQFGGSMGSEWVALKLALETLKTEFPDVRMDARHILRADGPASRFYDTIATYVTMEGSAELHKDAVTMAAVVQQQLPAWRAADATVLLLLTLPVADNKYGGSVLGPQWHTKPANQLWEMFQVLRVLSGLPDNRYVFLLVEPLPSNGAASPMLDQFFGEPWDISQHKTKIPTSSKWRLRSWPETSVSDLAVRIVECTEEDAQRFDSSLLAFRSDGSAVTLPTPEDVESYYDDLGSPGGSQRDMGTVEAFKLMHHTSSGPGSGAREPPKLLNRVDLARLWGVDGWSIDQTFSRVLPCHETCALSTGFAATVGGSDVTTSCGQGRWCYPCDQWYAVLHAAPPPHTYTLLHKLLRGTFSRATAGPNNHFAKLPLHQCDGSGCGTY